MDMLDCIMSRRSIRKYHEGASIPQGDIEKILTAASAAPSAANQQPWHFIVIDDRALLTQLAKENPHGKMVADASLAIAISYDKNEKKPYPTLIIDDLSAAAENILLAAHGLGYGAVWLAIYHDEAKVESTLRILKLTANVVVHSIISIGVPNESRTARTYLKKEMVHKNGW
ncbi:MAG: nitroreductase family protein [Deferribacteraceae bacterium]|jgi:nitroreductase|nr:nitroreductase family protein [Deferribacteraceae bacterium]